MSVDWIHSQTVRLIVAHFADSRPVWLWDAKGEEMLWRNAAAKSLAVNADREHRTDTEIVPLAGQVARAIRMGLVGRTSPARMQFTAGRKPLSLTCSHTPLALRSGELSLLVVGDEPVTEISPSNRALGLGPLLGPDTSYLLLKADGAPFTNHDELFARYQALRAAEGTQSARLAEFPAGPNGELIAIFDKQACDSYAPAPEAEPESEARAEEAEVHISDAPSEESDASVSSAEDAKPDETDSFTETHENYSAKAPEEPFDAWHEDEADETADGVHEDEHTAHDDDTLSPEFEKANKLLGLLDQLAGNKALFEPLGQDDDDFTPPSSDNEDNAVPDDDAQQRETSEDEDVSPTPDETAEDAEDGPAAVEDTPSHPGLWRLIGESFAANESADTDGDAVTDSHSDTPEDVQQDSPEEEAELESVDREEVERVSRYNFDELSRILIDRVSRDQDASMLPAGGDSDDASTLVNLSDETLILNRLPLGLLIFRDQEIVFTNRALARLIGYDDASSLRTAGLGAIFPDIEGTDEPAGPINELLRTDGTKVRVAARLQSVTWHGRPAMLLSAREIEVETDNSFPVRLFAESVAGELGLGLVEINRQGVILHANLRAAERLGADQFELIEKPLHHIVRREDVQHLRLFLERPARRAGEDWPCFTLPTTAEGQEMTIFTLGQAGIVSGYIALVRDEPAHAAPAQAPHNQSTADPALLARVSRGVRRPLNTIVGFSEIIRSGAFGPVENERYIEYARDIEAAGLEIAALVDELEDYARLQEGEYEAAPADFDLGLMLDQCLMRIRHQASISRVFVRSAISTRLPRIKADAPSLRQAVLNLLASAVELTPPGGQVVLSAQWESDGGISVHVRDSASDTRLLEDRFMVFREGTGPDGRALQPVKSTVGLPLTRSLLAVNACSLSVDPTSGAGTLVSLMIPADLISTNEEDAGE